jgi:hypothetical protein
MDWKKILRNVLYMTVGSAIYVSGSKGIMIPTAFLNSGCWASP